MWGSNKEAIPAHFLQGGERHEGTRNHTARATIWQAAHSDWTRCPVLTDGMLVHVPLQADSRFVGPEKRG